MLRTVDDAVHSGIVGDDSIAAAPPTPTHATRPRADLLKFKHYHTQKEMVHYTSYLLA